MTAPAARAAPPVVRLAEATSTQDVAHALAAEGAADGTAVVADHQTAGRGRRGRRWDDEPGASLLVSIVARPRLEPDRRPLLSYAAGVAVAEAVAEVSGLDIRLRWPNDVLLHGRKVAGILLESRDGAVVIGVGINVAQTRFPPALAGIATSLRLAGAEVDREALLAAVLAAVARWRARLEEEGFAPVRARWCALADTLGRSVRVDGRTGVAVDLDADGALVLRDGAAEHRVVAGDLEG